MITIPVLTTNPRSGTHYFKTLLSTALGVSALERNLDAQDDLRLALAASGGSALIYGHFRFSQHSVILDERRVPGLRIIVLTRHPFDRLISQLAWTKALNQSLPHPDHSPQRLARDLLLGHWDGKTWMNGLNVANYAALHNFYLRDLVVDWVAQRGGHLVKFEDLIADPLTTVRHCLAYLEVARSDAEIAAVTEHINFRSLSDGRSPGEIDELSHYRKGLSGEWLEAFGRSDLLALRAKYKCALAATGYEL